LAVPDAEAEALTGLIRELRGCFNRLKRLAAALHDDLAVTPSMRAVLEALADGADRTVPDIAGARGVTRQHVQVIMNALVDRALVESRANPAHRRSPRYRLSDAGKAVFGRIRDRETAVLGRLAGDLDDRTLAGARATLATLNRRLDEELQRGGSDAADDRD
jgi:DNA-binding MarR family transcriptional regulator